MVPYESEIDQAVQDILDHLFTQICAHETPNNCVTETKMMDGHMSPHTDFSDSSSDIFLDAEETPDIEFEYLESPTVTESVTQRDILEVVKSVADHLVATAVLQAENNPSVTDHSSSFDSASCDAERNVIASLLSSVIESVCQTTVHNIPVTDEKKTSRLTTPSCVGVKGGAEGKSSEDKSSNSIFNEANCKPPVPEQVTKDCSSSGDQSEILTPTHAMTDTLPAASPLASRNTMDDVPIGTKGKYEIDWDNIDAIDPFGSKTTVANSPCRIKENSPPQETQKQTKDSIVASSDQVMQEESPVSAPPEFQKQDHAGCEASSTDQKFEASPVASDDKSFNGVETAVETVNEKGSGVKAVSEPPSQPEIKCSKGVKSMSTGVEDHSTTKAVPSTPQRVNAHPSLPQTPPNANDSVASSTFTEDFATPPSESASSKLSDSSLIVQDGNDQTPKCPTVEQSSTNQKLGRVAAGQPQGTTAIVTPIQRKEDVTEESTVPEQHPPLKGRDSMGLSDDDFVEASSDLFSNPTSLDYLAQSDSNYVQSDLHRQSLYVKFDPLVDANSSKGPSPNPGVNPDLDSRLNNLAVADMTHSNDLMAMNTPTPGKTGPPKKIDSGTITIKKKPRAHVESMRRETPQNEIDKLLANSPNQMPYDLNAYDQPPPKLKFDDCQSPQDKLLDSESKHFQNMIQKLQLQFQADVLAKEREWTNALKEKEKALSEKNVEIEQLTAKVQDMEIEFREYEVAFSQLLERNERVPNKAGDCGESLDQVIRQRDQAVEDLQGVESSFSDLHRRYEKLKASTEESKKNEEFLKDRINELETKLKKSEDRFSRLKENAEDKLDKSNNEIERLQNLRETDTLGLRAQLKRADVQMESLQNTVEQKNKEIIELTEICDELISKAGKASSTG